MSVICCELVDLAESCRSKAVDPVGGVAGLVASGIG